MFGAQKKPFPRCPYCEGQIEKPLRYTIGYKETMYACPHCLRVIGFTKYDD